MRILRRVAFDFTKPRSIEPAPFAGDALRLGFDVTVNIAVGGRDPGGRNTAGEGVTGPGSPRKGGVCGSRLGGRFGGMYEVRFFGQSLK